MWLDCLEEMPYDTREDLGRDVVRVLREELHFLLAAGASLVQFDEPVLTEVVFGAAWQPQLHVRRPEREAGAGPGAGLRRGVVNEVTRGLPRERLGLHVCRGNWTPDESAALDGDYTPLLDALARAEVGTLFLELSTPRARDATVLKALPDDKRMAVGVVNQKLDTVESVEVVRRRVEQAINLFGEERVLLTPDCGFATFADNPVASARTAEAKLRVIAQARDSLRR